MLLRMALFFLNYPVRISQKSCRATCTESLSKYHLFLANDLPNIRVELLQDGRSKEGPFGAKSIGEVCYVPVAPAVCGAVNDALHANLSVLPYDPDCILKYLAEVRENHDA